MTISTLFVVFAGLVLSLAVAILWIKVHRPPKEDPRLSRGLQLLQNKIAVLEDLSDRTDRQAQQLISLLDERAKILQGKILQAQETIMKIEQSMKKSLDVAQIFQDKIPHEEIIERQNTAKYVHAAKLAHQGLSVEEIMQQVDLPRSEVEFIAKVNRDQLMFSEEHLPDWAKIAPAPRLTEAFQTPQLDFSGMKKISDDFKSAVREAEEREREMEERRRAIEEQKQQIVETAKRATRGVVSAAGNLLNDVGAATTEAAKQVGSATVGAARQVTEAAKPLVRRVQFPRIDRLP